MCTNTQDKKYWQARYATNIDRSYHVLRIRSNKHLLVPEDGHRVLVHLPRPDGHVVDLPHGLEAVEGVRDGAGPSRHRTIPPRGYERGIVWTRERPAVVAFRSWGLVEARSAGAPRSEGGGGGD